MSILLFSDQGSIFLYTLQYTGIQFGEYFVHSPIASHFLTNMPKIKVTARAKHPDRTQQFLNTIQAALDMFKDEISSLTEDICSKAYRNYVTACHEALVPVWNLARFANIGMVMETVADKDLKEITMMATCLKPASPSPKVVPPKPKIPDLKTITDAMLHKFLGKSLPESSVCKKIGDVFSNLSTAQTAYAEAARGLAELSTLLTPQQYTLLLTATATPAIQLVIPGQMILPLSEPPPPQPESSTAAGRLEIMKFTKMQVLPDPHSDVLSNCDDNSAMRVLAAAVYCQLERHYFDETHSLMDVAMLFHCNSSQLAKAITGVNYKSGPHHYKPKKRKGKADSPETDPTKAKTHRKEDIVKSD